MPSGLRVQTKKAQEPINQITKEHSLDMPTEKGPGALIKRWAWGYQNWFGSMDRTSAWGLKGPRFDSDQGHVPWLRSHPQ